MAPSSPSYLSSSAAQPLSGETIGRCLDRILVQHGDRDALVSRHQGTRFTYRALDEQVRQLARALLAMGLQKGDRVGLWSANCAEWVITQYAVARSGGILVGINPAFRLRELEHALTFAGVSILIAAPLFRQTDHAAMLEELAPELLTCPPGELASSRLAALRHLIYFGDDSHRGAWRWSDALGLSATVSDDQLRRREQQIDIDDPVSIQYTSGTTGQPKGATLSHHSLLNNGYFIGERQQFSEVDRICVRCRSSTASAWSMQTLPRSLTVRQSCCRRRRSTCSRRSRPSTPNAARRSMASQRCSSRSSSIHGLLSSVTTVCEPASLGGAPVPIELMRQITGRFNMPQFTIGYGMTEMSGVSFQSQADDDLERRCETVGAMLPHMECKIVAPDSGVTVPRGTAGEVCMRGYMVMLRYWNNPDATREAVDEAGWMHTGDLGVLREDGYAQIVGRLKDMIIRGGENIFPREIEGFEHAPCCQPGVCRRDSGPQCTAKKSAPTSA